MEPILGVLIITGIILGGVFAATQKKEEEQDNEDEKPLDIQVPRKPKPQVTRDNRKVEMWQTMEDEEVCEVCQQNSGKLKPPPNAHGDFCPITCSHWTSNNPSEFRLLQADEATDDIPAHPDCRCFWRAVPKWWHELLKTDPKKAKELDDKGLVDDELWIQDESGKQIATATVKFSSSRKKSPIRARKKRL